MYVHVRIHTHTPTLTHLHILTHSHSHPDTQCIDASRDILDMELTTLATESYSRAYGVMVSVQLLSELEETIRCLAMPERKPQLQHTWWKRLLVSTCTCLL